MNVRVFAPAKINLTLNVGRPRADGYHPLHSAVVFADVGDWVEAAPSDELSLSIDGPFAAGLEANGDNLVLRAARLLDASRGAALRLQKNLPIASGIGGGSSDAAATLHALNELWGLGKTQADLVALAARLGADAPVCVRKRSAWITGTGEAVAPMQTPLLHAVLVNPGKPLATPAVYRRYDEMKLGGDFEEEWVRDWPSVHEAWCAVMFFGNDLEQPAISLMPEIGAVLEALRNDKRGVCASLSGSGATCFALTHDEQDAAAWASDLEDRHPQWWVRAARLGAT